MASFLFTTISCALIYSAEFFIFSVGTDTLSANQTIADGQTLISQNQNFELGFFSPGTSGNRFLGIWYKDTPDVIVWVANRNNPIKDSHEVFLKVAENGSLVIIRDETIIWSSNSNGVTSNPILQLLNTGNLVLVDKTSDFLWQSFDYPGRAAEHSGVSTGLQPSASDTRLPGMRMVYNSNPGLEKHLTSWKSNENPSSGNFIYRIENQGLPEMVILRDGVKIYRSGTWNGVYINVPTFYNLVYKPGLVFDKDNKLISFYDSYNNSILTRLTIDQSGLLHRYTMNERKDGWNLVYTIPKDPCDDYGKCGPNGICRVDKVPICECLEGFTPKDKPDWDFQDWSGGCTRITPLSCQNGDGFLEVTGVKYPAMLGFWLNTSMSFSECRDECLRKCNCTAYAQPYINNGGSGCLMWFGDLIDTRVLPGADMNQNIYIRLPVSELESPSDPKNKKKNKPAKVVLISVASGILMSVVLCVGVFVLARRKRQAAERKSEDLELPSFSFATIAAATNNFSEENIIGEGGFGPVYKGNLSSEEEIAVKRLSETSGQGFEEFKNEVILFAKLQHSNLVRLLGCCINGDERMLIYEYLHNKSLDYLIFDQNRRTMLTWPKRCDAWLLWKDNKALELMDECLNDSFIESQVKRCIQVGLLCIQKLAEDRPVMSSVLFMLGCEGAVLSEPKEPGFFMERSSVDVENVTPTSKDSIRGTITITELEPR
ncbi:hypothetical protein DH2020_022921 [Rehmannia glutinosa]|uniref:Receptor-like serine/threonine-protein kinase n=1 Tax=Rehmannia glutinosa TaxID=99300 RepID=A0ABR0W4J2_REHGL